MICFDVEIEKGILGRGEAPVEGIAYCGGWRDFAGMGIACVATYELDTHLSQVFLKSQLHDLVDYIGEDMTCGFNTRRFDIPLLSANGIQLNQDNHYDALEQIWLALGLNPDKFVPSTHGGWGLDAIMQATFALSKSGNGAMAPIWWQQGKRGKVVSYCLRDVWLEAKLVAHMLQGLPINAAGKQTVTVKQGWKRP